MAAGQKQKQKVEESEKQIQDAPGQRKCHDKSTKNVATILMSFAPRSPSLVDIDVEV